MTWKVALALGIVFANPAIHAVQYFFADHACKAECRREVGDCKVTPEELDEIAIYRKDIIQKFLEEKGLTTAQKEAALRYLENRLYGVGLRTVACDELQKIKDWTKKNEPPESEKKKQDEAEHQGR